MNRDTIGTTEYTAISGLLFLSTGLDIDEPTAGSVVSPYAATSPSWS